MAKTKSPPTPKPKPAAQEAELVEMDQAIEMLKTTRPTFYRWLREGRIKGFKLGRQWRFRKEDLDRFLRGEEPKVELQADLRPLFDQINERLVKLGENPATFTKGANELEQITDVIILLTAKMRASDLHLESLNLGGKQVGLIRLRIDGTLYKLAEFDHRLFSPMINYWKTMANFDLNVRRVPQDNRIEIIVGDKPLDLRISLLPTVFGEALTARILSAQLSYGLDFEKWALAPEALDKLKTALACPYGLNIFCGPTGSGKTSMLYACLNKLSGERRKIISIEDPVEYVLPWVEQVPIRPQDGFTFPRALRASLRSAADVIMVGEIRDTETAEVSVEAAITGHLVLTTLHTADAVTGLARLIEISIAPFLVADTSRLTVAQRLVRRNCPDCSVMEPVPDQARLRQILDEARKGGMVIDNLPEKLKRGKGCKACNFTGYRGRLPVLELLVMTPEIGGALMRGASVSELRTLAIGQGMKTLVADAVRRMLAGETSLDEAMRLSSSLK